LITQLRKEGKNETEISQQTWFAQTQLGADSLNGVFLAFIPLLTLPRNAALVGRQT
jgi:hypothetical protein